MIQNTFLLMAMCLIYSCASTQSTNDTKQLIAEQAQPVTDMTQLPFRQIPDAPDSYTAEGVSARMIDGLGFRYYWATEQLRAEDLDYKITESARTMQETMSHLYGLSETIVNAVIHQPNIRPSSESAMTWEEQRAATLQNLKKASDILHAANAGEIKEYKIIFQRGDKSSEFPFWNMINGPISDAIWHTGQVVSFRRAAGNPIPPGVNVFTGKTFE